MLALAVVRTRADARKIPEAQSLERLVSEASSYANDVVSRGDACSIRSVVRYSDMSKGGSAMIPRQVTEAEQSLRGKPVRWDKL